MKKLLNYVQPFQLEPFHQANKNAVFLALLCSPTKYQYPYGRDVFLRISPPPRPHETPLEIPLSFIHFAYRTPTLSLGNFNPFCVGMAKTQTHSNLNSY